MRFLGFDAGSVSVKAVVVDEDGNKLFGCYRKHSGRPLQVARQLLGEVAEAWSGGGLSISITGSSGRLIASVLGVEPINEIVAQAYCMTKLYPHIRSVIEMGGEDSKLIILGQGVEDFSMNSVCAAGTGSFLDQQAERLRLSIEELSEMSLKCKKPPRIAGRCSVFAKSDMIHLQQIATPVEDIVAGLCFAVARNFKGAISRGRQVNPPVSFQGGVAANQGMVRAFREVFGLQEIFVPPDFALTGARGAALKALDEGLTNSFDPAAIDEFIASQQLSHEGHKPLRNDNDRFAERHINLPAPKQAKPGPSGRVQAYMGIDIGSISTNLAVIDEHGELISKRYLMTAGRPIEAVMRGLREISPELGDSVDILGVGTTGSGRYMIADYVGADIVKNEITAQATAAADIDPGVDTILEIGGQDSKFISMRDGIIVDFEMNKACAAGTGSFLEEQAEKLDIPIKEEFAKCAFCSGNPLKLGERCTVFMENSLMANLQKGASREDLLSGLAYSIVQNYINRVVAGKPIGEKVFFQGGVAFNKSVVAAFEKYLGREVIVPPNHDVTGAIGMALIAMRHMRDEGAGQKTAKPSTFKGFDLSDRAYNVSTFECKACPNVCEINRVKIEGEEGKLFYGGRCEKYDMNKKTKKDNVPDLFAFREEMLWSAVPGKTPGQTPGAQPGSKQQQQDGDNGSRPSRGTRPKIGIPYLFFFHDILPFWTTLLQSLGFDVEVSPKTDRSIINLGLEAVLSEACFPVKVAHGHIKYFLGRDVDAVLLPSFISLNRADEEYPVGAACPHTQTIPYVSRVAIEGIKTLTPIINTEHGPVAMATAIWKEFREFGTGKRAIRQAIVAATEAQDAFTRAIREKGRQTLAALDKRAVVIVGRGYNSFDKGVNLNIPAKLANLGVTSLPMDFLPLEDMRIKDQWPNMYWRSGQKILKAARLVRENPLLYPIFIGNFSCGPDSFILKFFREEMGQKPYLHIEIDEHSADAGAITRCEAFLDSIGNEKPQATAPRRKPPTTFSPDTKKTVYIPLMSDHSYALEAAFTKSGIPASVLPETTVESIDLGMRYVSGKECYPCIVTTGDMLKKAFSEDFKPEESVFFMPSGAGPCRFGQYNVFHRQVLDEAGLQNVPIFAPNQDVEFYRELGIAGKDFSLSAWKGIIAIELLYKCLHETRPYETEKGSADRLYAHHLKRLRQALGGQDGKVYDALTEIRQDFEALSTQDKGSRPLIGLIGEIFVRTNRFSNEDLIRKVEALGGECWLAPVEEWVYYINSMGLRQALIKRHFSDIMDISLKRLFQKRIEHKYAKLFKGYLRTLHEPSTSELLAKAAPYVHDSFEGETVLSIGKAVDLIERGSAGIINAMPFGCMPGTIVTALIRGVKKKYNIPSMSIPYDGTESPAMVIQLEAFMDQAKETHKAGRTVRQT